MDHASQATQYARDVVSGKILACKWVRLACQRHLDDLKRKDLPYIYSVAHANRVVSFIEALPHVKGRWAAKHEFLILQPWQKFVVCSLFGWLHKETGFRRFRESYICVPRKNGKSPLAAAIGLYMLCADNEVGAEVYTGATSQIQAYEVFRPAKQMAEKTPDLQKYLGVKVNAQSLVVESTGSRFVPVIGKPGDGSAPTCGIADEYHEAIHSELVDTFKTGMVGRDQPLLMVITTAGYDNTSPCALLQRECEKVLEKAFSDERRFIVIYGIDQEDDWTSEQALRKANPNLNVSVSLETLRHDQEEAIRNPAKANVFRTKHLNVWCSATTAWMNMVSWNRCYDPDLTEESVKDYQCWIGSDLASKLDLSAVVKLFRQDIDGKPHYYCLTRAYLPEARVNAPENQHYQQWAAQGHLVATPGSSMDYATLERDALEDISKFQIQEIDYDPRYADQFSQRVSEQSGIERVEVPPSPGLLSPAMKELEAAVADGRFHHDNNPVMNWCMSNVMVRESSSGNLSMPDKINAESKIDCAVALFIAMVRAMRAAPVEVPMGFFAF